LLPSLPHTRTQTGSALSAATASGLNYTANLQVFALRPKDVLDPTAGYFKASFVYPFSFRLQQEVTDMRTTSSRWAFAVRSPFPVQLRYGTRFTHLYLLHFPYPLSLDSHTGGG
jgi:hypothetical protein